MANGASCFHRRLLTSHTANSTGEGDNVLGMERYEENFIIYQSYLSFSEATEIKVN